MDELTLLRELVADEPIDDQAARTEAWRRLHGREMLRAGERRRHIIVALAAGAVVVVAAASAFATMRDLFFVKPFARGSLTRTVDGVRFSLYVPKTGWENGPHERLGDKIRTRGLLISKSTIRGQAAEEVIYWAGVQGRSTVTPCAKLLPSAADRSRADLAAAMASAPGTTLAGGPSLTKVGGRPATRVVLRVKEELGCQPGFFFTWPHSECWGACWLRTDVGDSIAVWIVDVGGKRLFFVAVTKPGAGEWQEIGDIKRSIRFE